MFGHGPREGKVRAARLLDEVGIGAERRFQLRKFSKGMIQRVGIAQALINEPEVVFLDEPMSGLDPLGRREVRELILRLRDKGCAVFFSSHVLSDAEALCSRVAILARGRLVKSGTLSDMIAFHAQGWELVVANLPETAVPAVGPRVRKVVKIGDLGFFYHSNEGLDIVGVAEVIAEAHRDTTTDDERWECVDIRAVEDMPAPPALDEIKKNPKLADMALVRLGRLSVQPVTRAEWEEVCRMGGLTPAPGI